MKKISNEVPDRILKFLNKLKVIIKDIESYEEGDTGDVPGYFVDEDMDKYLDQIKDLSETELKNHGYKNLEKMIETHKNYYGDKVDSDTMVKIIKFKLIK